jgi:hypothetical protein
MKDPAARAQGPLTSGVLRYHMHPLSVSIEQRTLLKALFIGRKDALLNFHPEKAYCL